MEELRVAFLVIGSLFIVAVLVHGIWKMRKQSAAKMTSGTDRQERIEPKTESDDGFDDLGIGQVRVISETETQESVEDDPLQQSEPEYNEAEASEAYTEEVKEESAEEEKEKPLYANVVSQPKPHLAATTQTVTDDIPEPPEFLLNSKDEQQISADPPEQTIEQPVIEEQPAAQKKVVKRRNSTRKRREPTLGDDQMRIDFDEPSFSAIDEPETQQLDSPQEQPEQEVLILNVRADDTQPLSGAALLPLLLTLGFKFGDQDIFHRHVNANGKGPVLFSLANMVKPGVFDIDNLENFTTPGISLFMVLPIDGDPHQVFNMMHNAARKIADEFGAQVLDGRRSVLTKQGVQRYVEKIREFERQRIIARSTQ